MFTNIIIIGPMLSRIFNEIRPILLKKSEKLTYAYSSKINIAFIIFYKGRTLN